MAYGIIVQRTVKYMSKLNLNMSSNRGNKIFSAAQHINLSMIRKPLLNNEMKVMKHFHFSIKRIKSFSSE